MPLGIKERKAFKAERAGGKRGVGEYSEVREKMLSPWNWVNWPPTEHLLHTGELGTMIRQETAVQ